MRALRASVLVLAVALGPAAAQGEVQSVSTDSGSGITIEVEGWTGLSSPVTGRDVGLIPVEFSITNGSAAEHVWNIDVTREWGAMGIVPVARIAAPRGTTVRATVYVGTPSGYGSHCPLRITGPGASDSVYVDRRATGARHGGGTPLPCGVSKEVQAAQGNPFAKYVLSGNPLDMARAPADWRGWSTLPAALLTEAEWRSLAGDARKALLDWAATGGRAGVLVADPTPERLDGLGLPPAGPDGRRRVGAGEVVVVPWDGTQLKAAAVDRFVAAGGETREKLLELYRPGSGSVVGMWEPGFGRLFDTFGTRSLPVGWILAFLTVFGLVAGPLNLMVLAGAGRRSRMFWTTPLISLVATVFLLALMFLRDGVGGTGTRRVLGLLAPAHNSMAVVQEQFSRTGVLFGGSFPIAEPAWLQPLGRQDGDERFVEADGRTREGDWFRSRSDQAFVATAVRPSRARIELVDADGGPAVISSVEVPLDEVFVIDDEGRYWTAADVGTGQKKPLVASDAAAYERWFEAARADAGPIRRQALEAVQNLRGYAYASATADVEDVAVRTLASIRWVGERADFVGPFTRSRP